MLCKKLKFYIVKMKNLWKNGVVKIACLEQVRCPGHLKKSPKIKKFLGRVSSLDKSVKKIIRKNLRYKIVLL